ncbi:CcdC family protein [Paenibacillus sp. GCM10027626]|uniref:CcdC family protein n=1 Tax=Paenibacillus sp. GCM10027626 TaxID=3273411 RepID=UPI00362F1F7D
MSAVPNFQLSHLASLFISIAVGAAIVFLRLRAANRPTTLRKIMIPPVAMSSGFLMFAAPQTHVPWLWALAAFAAGALFFAYPLIRTSKLELRDGQIILIRSKMFIVLLLSLLIIRLVLHDVLEAYITIPQTAALFFILAFGMILVWRLTMVRKFLRLQQTAKTERQ